MRGAETHDDKKTGGRSARRCGVEVVEAAKLLFILIVKKGRRLPRVVQGKRRDSFQLGSAIVTAAALLDEGGKAGMNSQKALADKSTPS